MAFPVTAGVDYEPTSAALVRVKSRISAQSWEQRVAQARRDEVVIRKIIAQEARTGSLNAALRKVLPKRRRSWAIRRITAYRKHGFEALIDARTPREPAVSTACRQVVQTARELNPRITADEVLELLRRQKLAPLPSTSTIKREFARVDARRKYARKKAARAADAVQVSELSFAGGE